MNPAFLFVRSPIVLVAACGFAFTGCRIMDDGPRRPRQETARSEPANPAVAPPAPVAPPTDGGSDAQVSASVLRERAMETVESLSRDEDAQVRANAVEAASYAPQRLRGVIDAGLTDTSPGVRTVALMAVGREKIRDLAKRAVGPLRDQRSEVRAAAIYALANNGQEVDLSPLATVLLNDQSPWASRQAVFILGELRNPTAIPLLASAARQRTGSLPTGQQRVFELQIAEALVKLGQEDQLGVLRAALYPQQPEDLESAALAAQVLGELNDRKSIGQLQALLAYRERSGPGRDGNGYPAEVRLSIAGALARMGVADGVAVAEEFRAAENPALRAQAAFVYGFAGGPVSLGRLAEMLQDPLPQVRIAAAGAILRAGKR